MDAQSKTCESFEAVPNKSPIYVTDKDIEIKLKKTGQPHFCAHLKAKTLTVDGSDLDDKAEMVLYGTFFVEELKVKGKEGQTLRIINPRYASFDEAAGFPRPWVGVWQHIQRSDYAI